MALLVVSIVNALILAWPIARSRWHGLKLIGAMVLVFFGTQTFHVADRNGVLWGCL